MDDDELHGKAATYATNRRDAYVEKMKRGEVKSMSKQIIDGRWLAHYEGYREGYWRATGDTRFTTDIPVANLKKDEPVAYINVEERKLEWATPTRWETPTVVNMDKVPLYTKKEWVNLTDDEMLMIYAQPHEGFKYSLGRMIQAKLKEKNT